MWLLLLVLVGLLGLLAGVGMFYQDSSLPKGSVVGEVRKVSIIIPARNEEKNLPRLLDSLAQQTYPIHEVIVADDDSSDQTSAISQAKGATVLSLGEREWTGKSNACWQGAKFASGDVCLFIDADTWFGTPESLGYVVHAYENQGATGVVSVQPYHEIKKLSENFSAWFNILVVIGMNHVSVFGNRLEPAGVYGPFVLASRKEYFHVGGHKQARHTLVEGFSLGEAFKKARLPVSLYTGKGHIGFQMYGSGFIELANGWTKHMASGSKGTHPLIWVLLLIWMFGALAIPSLFILFAWMHYVTGSLLSLVIYSVYVCQIALFARKTGNFNEIFFLIYPILLFFFLIIFIRSFFATYVKKSVMWKGRKLDI